jgi:hypothetical protein
MVSIFSCVFLPFEFLLLRIKPPIFMPQHQMTGAVGQETAHTGCPKWPQYFPCVIKSHGLKTEPHFSAPAGLGYV